MGWVLLENTPVIARRNDASIFLLPDGAESDQSGYILYMEASRYAGEKQPSNPLMLDL